ncbi:cytochrome P450 2J2-like isoform X7 [Anguilla anguilla]|uniref:cytochrome P450 2J2-like isoform X6 n=1 Tax=Anguilla anguilla TaxID=7936 RepID=UPI0015AEE888|nr:cytochrome P450 2J2-like isoform X6 [Anguilla anguilla]XP_035268411.1 cytochrome P450 2J2-like isoform X7 [Anguilla anguilla]
MTLQHALLAWFNIGDCLIFLLVFLLISYILKNKTPPNFPPGPWSVPFLGNVFFGLDFRTIDKLAEEYGSVFSLRRGSEKTVFVSGFRTVKEALVNQGQSFTDRPVSPLFDEIYKGHGLSFTNGYVWHKQKQFALAHLKNFGEGRKTLEFHILKECDFLSEVIREEQGNCLWSTGGGPFDPHEKLNNAVANIIGVLVFGRRFEYGDIRFQKLLRMSAESVSLTGSAGAQLYDSYPRLLKYFPGVHQTIISNYGKLANFLREEIDKHVEDWDPSNPRDYIDCYLMEIEKRKNDTEAGFNKENLVFCTVDLFEGGTETTTNTMRWALLFMMKYMNVQKKVQAEIDRVIGQSRQPTLADRGDMPYTDAVIHEIQRMGNIVPLNMARIASKDTTLGGCCLPKVGQIYLDCSRDNDTNVSLKNHPHELCCIE